MTIRRISIAILVAACCVLAALLLLARRPAIAPIERPAPGEFLCPPPLLKARLSRQRDIALHVIRARAGQPLPAGMP